MPDQTLPALVRRVRRHLAMRRDTRILRTSLQPAEPAGMQTLGDRYGGYTIPLSALGPDSRCYLCGTGTDITFDLLLIAATGCRVLAMDPVPAAIEYVAWAAAYEPRHEFLPVALWDRDEQLTFHAPRIAGFVSHSAIDMHGTPASFEAQARSLRGLMEERGDSRVDLLKISAEGSEYRIIDHLIDAQIEVGVLAIEFATPVAVDDARTAVDRLLAAGYRLLAARVLEYNWKLTFAGPSFGAT